MLSVSVSVGEARARTPSASANDSGHRALAHPGESLPFPSTSHNFSLPLSLSSNNLYLSTLAPAHRLGLDLEIILHTLVLQKIVCHRRPSASS